MASLLGRHDRNCHTTVIRLLVCQKRIMYLAAREFSKNNAMFYALQNTLLYGGLDGGGGGPEFGIQ